MGCARLIPRLQPAVASVSSPVAPGSRCIGHPTARWEGIIRAVSAEQDKIQVRYVGFTQSWDEWIAAKSPRLGPRRLNAPLRWEDIFCFTTSFGPCQRQA